MMRLFCSSREKTGQGVQVEERPHNRQSQGFSRTVHLGTHRKALLTKNILEPKKLPELTEISLRKISGTLTALWAESRQVFSRQADKFRQQRYPDQRRVLHADIHPAAVSQFLATGSNQWMEQHHCYSKHAVSRELRRTKRS